MIPPEVKGQEFMLAKPSKLAPAEAVKVMTAEGGWWFEYKWDGERVMALVEDGVVTLRSRQGIDITSRFPKVATALALAYPRGNIMFDGELLCFDTNGKPDFAAVLRKNSNATFIAFDVLYDGLDLRHRQYETRFGHLLAVAEDWPLEVLQPTIGGRDGVALWAQIERYDLEGLVAKRSHAPYRAGRSGGDWVKLKARNSVSVVITGATEGQGWTRSTFGALEVSVWDRGELVSVGHVGSGFSERDRREIVNVGLAGGGKLLVAEVEYLNVTDGKLRQPVFKGLRTDVNPDDCTIDQLERSKNA